MAENTVSKNEVRAASQDAGAINGNIFSTSQGFNTAVRMAQALSKSSIVPREYQGEAGLGNAIVALEMSSRLNISPLMVMQNLYTTVNGRPAWSSQFIIAMINNSGKYKTELQFEFVNEDKGDERGCYAYVVDRGGKRLVGPTITIKMAKDEGWYQRNGSKWKTMPEIMLRYRAASFFGRLYCPDLVMGLYSREEVIDIGEDGFSVSETVEAVNAEAAGAANAIPIDTTPLPAPEATEKATEAVDGATGEIPPAVEEDPGF